MLIKPIVLAAITVTLLSPLSPNSDEHQISSCDVNALSIREVMRIEDMITQDEFSISPHFLKRNVWVQERRICILILGIKGLSSLVFIRGNLSN